MKQDDFERLMALVAVVESQAECKADEQMCAAIRCGIGILERFVVAVEKIAANTAPAAQSIASMSIDFTKGPVA